MKPAKPTSITGSAFNQFFTSGFIGTNPTSFQAQTGITMGNAGKLICNTSGNATMKLYGESDFGFNQYSYTVRKLKKACKVQVGKRGATYVNMLPTSANGYGFLANTDGTNHKGWPNDPNDCYFNDVPFDLNYVSCSTQGTFTLMSIALTAQNKNCRVTRTPERTSNCGPLSCRTPAMRHASKPNSLHHEEARDASAESRSRQEE